jgi:hypothetical protein
MTTRTKRKPPIPEADRDEAARLILSEYFDFLLGGPPPGEGADPKAFAGRHGAAKAALSHLEQLFKTAGGGTDEEAGAAETVGGQLDAARAAMASLEGEGADTDGDGDG